MTSFKLKTLIILFSGILVILFSFDINAVENKIYIGLNIPLSGSYVDQGEDQKRAYELAVEQINKTGGVLGKQLGYIIKDTETNADVARFNAIELIKTNKVVMITGGSSSAVAIAQSEVCQENGIIFMAALTHSKATTGYATTPNGAKIQTAHRHTFRWYFNDWMTAKALGPYLNQKFGEGAEYFYITADYTWGHSLEESMRWVIEMSGSDTIGSILTKLGQKDFQSELKQAENATPDVLVLNLFGRDMVMAMKQAYSMGLKNKMEIVVPLMELNMARGVGPEAMAGIISTVNWYWQLADRFVGSDAFVQDYMAKYKKAPGCAAASAWVAIHEWADAVKRTGSHSSVKIIQSLEGHKFTLLKDEEEWRNWDHQAISSVFIVQGKAATELTGEWDLLKIIMEIKGENVVRSLDNNPVSLELLE